MEISKWKYDDFPLKSYDKVRYRDTDRQGHVNNAVFSSFFETGRVELLFNPLNPLYDSGCQFVIAELQTSLLHEIIWPGTVEIGTVITRVGTSSISISQAIFQFGKIVATANTVVVQMNESTRKSQPIKEETKKELLNYTIKEA